MTAWPAGLPYPRATGAQRQANKGAQRFEVDAGPAKQRPVTTVAFERLDLTYRCTRAQADTLWDFYWGDAAQGGVWFDYIHPFTGTAGQARFLVGQEPKEAPASGLPKFDMAVSFEFSA